MVEGTALGMAVEAQQLVDETDRLIADKIEEYGTSGHKGAVIMTGADDPSTFYIYLPTDPRGAYLIDLGIELPDSVKALAESEPADSIALTLSSEQADQFADLEIAVMYGDEALLEQLQADPLLSAIPAIAKGSLRDAAPRLDAGGSPATLRSWPSRQPSTSTWASSPKPLRRPRA